MTEKRQNKHSGNVLWVDDTHLQPMCCSDFFAPFLIAKDAEQMQFWQYYPHHLFSIGIGCLRPNPDWGPEQGRMEKMWIRRWLPGQGLLLAALAEGISCRCETIHILNSEQAFPETIQNRVLQLDFVIKEVLIKALKRYCCEPWFKEGETGALLKARNELEDLVTHMEADAEAQFNLLLWVGHSKTWPGLIHTDLPRPWPDAPVLCPKTALPKTVLFIDAQEREALIGLAVSEVGRANMCMLWVLGCEEPDAVPVLNPADMIATPTVGKWLSYSPFGPEFRNSEFLKLASQLRQFSSEVSRGLVQWYDEVRKGCCLLYQLEATTLLALMEKYGPSKLEGTFISCAGPDDDWEHYLHTEALSRWLKTDPTGVLYLAVVAIEAVQTQVTEIDDIRTALREQITHACTAFRRERDSGEPIGGGLSPRECVEIAEDKAKRVLNRNAASIGEYRTVILEGLEAELNRLRENTFDEYGLSLVTVKECILPVVMRYFEERGL